MPLNLGAPRNSLWWTWKDPPSGVLMKKKLIFGIKRLEQTLTWTQLKCVIIRVHQAILFSSLTKTSVYPYWELMGTFKTISPTLWGARWASKNFKDLWKVTRENGDMRPWGLLLVASDSPSLARPMVPPPRNSEGFLPAGWFRVSKPRWTPRCPWFVSAK